MIDDGELARRSILGFGETVAMLGRWGVGEGAVVRRPDVLGARIDAAGEQPWINAVVVPSGARPPDDDPLLPYCLWAEAERVAGRIEEPSLANPCLGLRLDDPQLRVDDGADAAEPSLAVVGGVNERAYGQPGILAPLLTAVRDPRLRAHGLRDGEACVCVALTLRVEDDLSIQYVATEATHRRRGLAGRLLLQVMAWARDEGMRTATLQASPDGLPVYQRLGFRRVATRRAFLRPKAG